MEINRLAQAHEQPPNISEENPRSETFKNGIKEGLAGVNVSEKGITKSMAGIIAIIVIIAVVAGVYVVTRPPAAEAEYKLAVILPGSIYDADWNATGYITAMAIAEKYGIPVAYSERVAVPDGPAVIEEYIALGYNIIWGHGGQWPAAIKAAAPEHPDVAFIMETDAPLPEPLPNVWNLHRNFHSGFYALGALAGLVTKTDKIGYIGGVALVFHNGELRAVRQALDVYNPDAEIMYAFIGDYNKPYETRLQAEAMIAAGCDVILGSTNLGIYGQFDAARAHYPAENVWQTCKYTDKAGVIPELYLTSYLYDFNIPLFRVIDNIMAGNLAGYDKIEFGKDPTTGEIKGCYIQFPIRNVTPAIEATIKSICENIEAGTLVVKENLDPLPAGFK